MTQPSDAYVDWATGEGRSIIEAVQKEWKPSVGDWVRTPEGLELVVGTQDTMEHGVLIHTAVAPITVLTGTGIWPRKDCCWCPSLSQWLDMIRDISDLEWFKAETFNHGRRWEFRGGIKDKVGQAAQDEMPEIAAAQLWGRLEGVG